MKTTEKTMDKIVALCKNRGFVSPVPRIYGGLANSWDYGPLGVELKNNVKRAWWQKFVQEKPLQRRPRLRHPHEPAGLGGFRPRDDVQSDPLIDCRKCQEATAPTSSSRVGARDRLPSCQRSRP